MTQIKLWTFTICAAAVLAGMVEIITPKPQKKSVALVVNLILLLVLLSPLANNSITLDSLSMETNDISLENTQDMVDDLYRFEIESKIIELAHEKLDELGIIAGDIGIDISVKNGQLDINMLTVVINEWDETKARQVKSSLEEYLGIPVTVAGETE